VLPRHLVAKAEGQAWADAVWADQSNEEDDDNYRG
jgi:hypothetical protein